MTTHYLKNGILYRDNHPVLAVGQSYYPSFHPKKMPVPPDHDQYGEMEVDLENIRKAGFNIVRTAALGEIKAEGDSVLINMPFIDRMIEKAGQLGMAMQVRLQGYSVNIHGWQNTQMVRRDGVSIKPHDWSNFMLDCLHHAGIREDNRSVSSAVAQHFRNYPAVVSYVTYNEPHYPGDGIYDYHPSAIEEYRKWLTDTGRMPADQASRYEPPRRRPIPGESPEEWIRWRLFAIESMTNFLSESAAITKNIAPDFEMLTCLTPNMVEFDNVIKGVDYFRGAEGMDILGLTLYKNAAGGDYDTTAMILACAESAAALCGKHFWMVELDAATNIPLRRFLQQNLLALGMGAKGMMFYQWRGDYPYFGTDTPEPNGFGFLNNDNTPTEHYQEKLQFVRFMNTLSPYFVGSERLHSKCGILFSHHAAMHCDALENGFDQKYPRHRLGRIEECMILHNSCMATLRRLYRDLCHEDTQPVFVESRHLKDNQFELQSLYVLAWDRLSKEEQNDVRDFQAQGGKVFVPAEDIWQPGLCKCGYELLNCNKNKYDASYTLEETLELAGIAPIAHVSTHSLAVNWTQGRDFMVAAVINISSLHETISNATIKPEFSFRKAMWYSLDGMEQHLEIDPYGNVILPEICHGGIAIFRME